jgi:hypothetical protein
VSRILREHRGCEAGFDVSRQPGAGGGRLRILCKGCGQEMAYHASDAGRWGGLQDFDADRGVEDRREEPEGGSRTPAWRATALVACLVIAGGLTAVVLADEGDDRGSEPLPVTSASEPSPPPKPEVGKEPAGKPSSTAGQGVLMLNSRVIPSGSFSIGLTPGWKQSSDDGAIVFARGGRAQVRVYYESGALSFATMLEALGDLLSNDHPKARVSAVSPTQLGGLPARKLTARYPGGREIGVATIGGGYSYFVLLRIDRGASPAAAREARAIQASFRPLN